MDWPAITNLIICLRYLLRFGFLETFKMKIVSDIWSNGLQGVLVLDKRQWIEYQEVLPRYQNSTSTVMCKGDGP